MNRSVGSGHFLLFRSASCIGALALCDVREIMRPLPLEPLADSPPLVLGLCVIRGTPAPVIDAAQLMQPVASNGCHVSAPTRFIALNLGDRSAALAVDSVLDVRTLSHDTLQSIPLFADETGGAVVSRFGALDSQLMLLLNAARVVPEAIWAVA